MTSDEEIVWRATIDLIDEAQPLSEQDRAALAATRPTLAWAAIVHLEVPDEQTRELVERLRDPITTALSQLANGYIIMATVIKRRVPDPAPNWIATAASNLRR